VIAASGTGPVVWLVRHAESAWNEGALVQGQASAAPGLTTAGAAQARLLAEALAGCGAGAVFSSDLPRAIETATPIAERLGVTVRTDRRLRERSFGRFEGGPSSALDPAAIGWVEGGIDLDARPEGGESVREVYARAADWVDAVRSDPPAPVLVAVAHGGFLRVARVCIAREGFGAISPIPIRNGAVWRADLGLCQVDTEPESPYR
jgi:2,3-bisphosphoglycerate-dependent phosphoglycerate mutase